MLNIGLSGTTGKMGRQIIAEIITRSDKYNVKAALIRNLDQFDHNIKNHIGNICNDINQIIDVDVIIDYSNPALITTLLDHAILNNTPLLIGTTGFDNPQLKMIEAASKKIPILLSPNTSISINLLFNLVNTVAKSLTNFDAEILEMHHRNKLDSPSGTALKIGEIIAKARGISFDKYAIFNRTSNREKRSDQQIGFSSIRGGNIVGEHEVFFINDNEQLSIKSSITNRSCFAVGALLGAEFLNNQTHPGLYSMLDVLSL